MHYLFIDIIMSSILGLIPSFIWLCFFLREDVLPEPKKMVLKIFLFGMLSILPIFVLAFMAKRFGFEIILDFLRLPIFPLSLLLFFWATIEEVLKYLAVRYGILFHSEFDEPIDAMLYMIIAGLGFAGLENILYIYVGHPFLGPVEIAFWRFVSATLLHALVSGILGYFIALSFLETKKRGRLFISGIFLASFLHFFYNFSLKVINGPLGDVMIIIILIFLIIFVFFGFKKLKKMKSVCKIN